uniref:Uncharacterized protein n=1 Tax=Oryza brachyantha TaxID=4533 RepID=J3KXC9_ORYBR
MQSLLKRTHKRHLQSVHFCKLAMQPPKPYSKQQLPVQIQVTVTHPSWELTIMCRLLREKLVQFLDQQWRTVGRNNHLPHFDCALHHVQCSSAVPQAPSQNIIIYNIDYN